jgi:NhaA family Na+:H+ antiporter
MKALRRPELTSGLLAVAAVLAALAIANSSLRPLYDLVHHTPVALRVGALYVEKPLIAWINEGLMVFFFLLVALEIKREALAGHLASRARIALPAIAALGGMLVPAGVYWLLAAGEPGAEQGWAVPIATDTVLALAALNALGAAAPAAVKAFLTAFAIFDDLGAIVILAMLFTAHLSVASLLVAAGALAVLAWLNRRGVTRPSAYVVAGVVLWAAVLESGVHATLAGFLIGLALPLRTREGATPLASAEKGLRPWVAFGVVPVFAFFNAGVALIGAPEARALSAAVVAGTAAGLVLGKPVGIMGAAWLAVRLRAGTLPDGVRWPHVLGAALLGGIGFTMSLFFAALAFGTNEVLVLSAKVGVLSGSLVAAMLGVGLLWLHGRRGTGGSQTARRGSRAAERVDPGKAGTAVQSREAR